MINILLVDDESGQLEIMKNIIEDLCSDYNVICFDNSIKAYEYISSNPVDAVITDIKMPGMDGIELSMKISQLNRDIIIAIISAYSDFEYAQKAINYGVIGYLIKPISHSKINELFSKINEEIAIKSASKKQIDSLNSQLESYKSIYIEKQLKSWLNNTVSAAELDSIKSLFKYSGYGIVVASQVANFSDGLFPLPEDFFSFIKINIHRLLSENQQVLTIVYDDEKLIFVSIIVGKNDLHLDSVYKSFCTLSAMVKNEYNADILSGASDIALSVVDNVQLFLKQALLSLDYTFLNSSTRFLSNNVVQNMKLIDNAVLYTFQGKILDQFYLYDAEGVSQMLEVFCQTHTNNGFILQRDILEQYFINIIFIANKHVLYQYNDGVIEKIKSCHSIYMLKAVVEDYLKSLIIFQQKKLDEVTHQAIDKVKAYIDQHYTENICLELIADQMHFNPNYMGHLFKQKFGIGFKEYIISMRINKAKDLLSKTNLKVYEVAEKSGYCDVPYFIKIFKKETGISPNKFRIG